MAEAHSRGKTSQPKPSHPNFSYSPATTSQRSPTRFQATLTLHSSHLRRRTTTHPTSTLSPNLVPLTHQLLPTPAFEPTLTSELNQLQVSCSQGRGERRASRLQCLSEHSQCSSSQEVSPGLSSIPPQLPAACSPYTDCSQPAQTHPGQHSCPVSRLSPLPHLSTTDYFTPR